MRRIFVFGSNTEGRHGKGAALEAKQKYGAIQGQARGLQGDSYAIVTKDLSKGMRSIPLESIATEVKQFIDFARRNRNIDFIVSPIGCGLAGYSPSEIAPMFRYAPSNVDLPDQFVEILQPLEFTIAATGHRPDKLGREYEYEGPYSNMLLSEFTKILVQYEPSCIITGMALGVDTLWVLAGMTLGIPFIAAVPFEGQETKWLDESKEMYWNILNHPLCNQVVKVCEPGYAGWKMQKRNVWMIDHSDLLVSVWDGTDGGTANCCKAADKCGRQRINIDPIKMFN